MRLNERSRLPASVQIPEYGPAAQACGIVHFGIGAFHRAHQAVYTDDAMNAGDRDWRITGVSLRLDNVAMQMNPQDGLYNVVTRDGDRTTIRLIGSESRVLVARRDGDTVVEAVAHPDTKIISFTVTEKGYCRADDGSLASEKADGDSIYAYLAAGLKKRMDEGQSGVTLLSCDNLADNGSQLEHLLGGYLADRDPILLRWISENCAFPSSMVDRIVPATTEADRHEVERLTGSRDEACVFTEPFSQWVIEDNFAGPRPRWEMGGAEFVSDVAPYETAKLRMLNGAHSALAYLGLLHGHIFVHEAVADRHIRPVVERIMRDEAAPSVSAAPGQNLQGYADDLLVRFGNHALQHRLIQIAMDGSQKIPQRWLETLSFHQAARRICPAILEALAAWIIHIRGDRDIVDDPMAEKFAALWRNVGHEGIVTSLFGRSGIFAAYWVADERSISMIANCLDADILEREI
ncbi:mannitol dehydrogenase family protein [uncultured Parasphingorhabdus sp.]|uniref:mannitol dehydrogenase family protein n=1 Tax=uncultured Parasphingorhabdus sp. TaxID=2709694 RepID=UPI0030DC050F|tara:strand:+ start:76459 stop:77847 length:1389 start_codon:yes stop_codon:yes gene_type:complete